MSITCYIQKYQTVHPITGHTDNPPIPVFDKPATPPPHRTSTPTRPYTPEHDHADFDVAPEHEEDSHLDIEPIPHPPASEAPSVSRNAEYAARLAEAQAEIAQLKEMLASQNELRRRKPVSDDGSIGATDDGASLIEQSVQPEGVPLNVVAILSFVVFVVTYLFF